MTLLQDHIFAMLIHIVDKVYCTCYSALPSTTPHTHIPTQVPSYELVELLSVIEAHSVALSQHMLLDMYHCSAGFSKHLTKQAHCF